MNLPMGDFVTVFQGNSRSNAGFFATSIMLWLEMLIRCLFGVSVAASTIRLVELAKKISMDEAPLDV